MRAFADGGEVERNPDGGKATRGRASEGDALAKYRAKLSALCARREMCEMEVVQRLAREGLSQEQVDSVVSYLSENRFIDDARYAWHFARHRARFLKWGNLKIEAALRAKGLSEAVIAEAINRLIEEDEGVDAEALLRRRLESLPAGLSPYKQRERLLRFAMGKGIEAEEAITVVERLLSDRDDRGYTPL